MFNYYNRKREYIIFSTLSRVIVCVLSLSLIFAPSTTYAQSINLLNLPAPGTMVLTSPAFNPAIITGIKIYPDNPLQFDFIIDIGDDQLQGEALRQESQKLINYFMATLTVPEDEMWVNLSPYEKDRIIAEGLSFTEMGRDMLAQDYLLKQLSASLMYPEDDFGKKFWNRVYAKAQAKYGTTEIPMNTFNKIWIVPDEAVVYVHDTNVFVVENHLKVMLEEDYLALESNVGSTRHGLGNITKDDIEVISGVSAEIVREVLLPEIEKEVNEGKNFANLRQMYNSMLLATWYKKNLKESLLGQVYANKNKVNGIELDDKEMKQKIYDRYVEAFEKGVYNYIKEDVDSVTKEIIPRKYFSGGLGNYNRDDGTTRFSETRGSSPVAALYAIDERPHAIVTVNGKTLRNDEEVSSPVSVELRRELNQNLGYLTGQSLTEWHGRIMSMSKNMSKIEQFKIVRILSQRVLKARDSGEISQDIFVSYFFYYDKAEIYIPKFPFKAKGRMHTEIPKSESSLEKRISDIILQYRPSNGLMLVGQAGEAAVGKTVLTKRQKDYLEQQGLRVRTLNIDSYLRPRDERRAKNLQAFDKFDLGTLKLHIQHLREGRLFTPPEYISRTGAIGEGKRINPNELDVVIIEGNLTFAIEEIRNKFDLNIYMDEPFINRFGLRVDRDVAERGYSFEEAIVNSLEIQHTESYLVREQQQYADIIVSRVEERIFKVDEAMLGSSPAAMGLSEDVSLKILKGLGLQSKLDPTAQWFDDGHPSKLYHNLEHSNSVAGVAYRFAKSRGLSEEDAIFLFHVGLLHDFDSEREKDTAARVPSTLDLLTKDFERVESLKKEIRQSVLIDELGWTKREYLMAKAIIQRTEFPFGKTHPNPAYQDTSPFEEYEKLLQQLREIDPSAVEFVIREGAIFSEYADKSGSFFSSGFLASIKTIADLYEEITNKIPLDASQEAFIGNNYDVFISKLGFPEAFDFDREIAEKFRFKDIQFPTLEQALSMMPDQMTLRFRANVEGFRILNKAYKALESQPQAFEESKRQGIEAFKTVLIQGGGVGGEGSSPVVSKRSATPGGIERSYAVAEMRGETLGSGDLALLSVKYPDEPSVASSPITDGEIDQFFELAEIPSTSIHKKPARQVNEAFAEFRASMEIEKDIIFLISELQIISADEEEQENLLSTRENALIDGLRMLYQDMPVDIKREDLPYKEYMDMRNHLKKNRDDLMKKIEEAYKVADIKVLQDLNVKLVRINSQILKLQVLTAGMILLRKTGLREDALRRNAALATLQGALNTTKKLQDELRYRISRLKTKEKIQQFETTDWVGNLVRTVRLGGFDISFSKDPDSEKGSVSVRQIQWINVNTRLEGIRLGVQRGEITASLKKLDVLISLYNTRYLKTLGRYGEIRDDLIRLRNKIQGFEEGVKLEKEIRDELTEDIKSLTRAIKHPKQNIWTDVVYSDLDESFRSMIHRIEGYIPEYVRISKAIADLQYYNEQLKEARRRGSLAIRSQSMISNGLNDLEQWAAAGLVDQKQIATIDISATLRLIKSNNFEDAVARLNNSIRVLQSRLEDIESRIAGAKKRATTIYGDIRDRNIALGVDQVLALVEADTFEDAENTVNEIREGYFDQRLVEPGYIRAELLLRKTASMIHGASKIKNLEVTINRIRENIKNIKSDIEHKRSFRITVENEEKKLRSVFINPGTTFGGLLAMGKRDVQVITIRYKGRNINEEQLRLKIPDLAEVTLRSASSPIAKQPGGIDFNPNHINLREQGNSVQIQFNAPNLEHLNSDLITGILPVIINITPLPSILPLLGLAPKEEEFEVSSLN